MNGSMKSICIDGANIGLPKGSGIATYGRNLLTNARVLGLGTQVLYGPAVPRTGSEVLNETALFEAEKPNRKMQKTERFRRTVASRFGRKAFPVVPGGEVIWPTQGGGRPEADRFWAAQDLYLFARRAFNRYRTVTPLSFAATSDAPAPDVMHWTSTLPMHAKGVPNIYTIHDLIPLRLPHTTADDTGAYMAMCQSLAKRADHIAVVSETTRQDVIRILKVPEERVTNTYQAVSIPEPLTSRPDGDVARELEDVFNLGWKAYFLHFGAIEPKKNLGRIVEAYLASGSMTPLVIVGGRAWLDEGETALLNQIRRDGAPGADRIRQYEYMPFAMLISLIRGARATVFPSLYEGFGLPVLESMALGTAVLTSTAGSLPEVAGNAAISVDPYDVQAMAEGLRTLDADEGFRVELVARGRVQAGLFTPEAYQHRLRQLYHKVGIL